MSDRTTARLNDGKTDRQGRFLAGTMHLHRGEEEPVVGGLFRLNPDGTVMPLVGDIATSNGPCFSPDGHTFYLADSSRQTIWAYDYALLHGSRCGRTEPDPCSGSCDADVVRASEVEHSVQHVGRDRHLGRLPPVRLEA
jgi:sugar lactone lactonase YvrE